MPRKTDSSNPVDWISFAESDLRGLRLLAKEEISPEMCASKLAEVLEKVLKAELIRVGWPLERTHDLEKLANELNARGSELVPEIRILAIDLAEVYFADRYPGFDLEELDWTQFRSQLAQVETVLSKVKQRLLAGSTPPPSGAPPQSK